MDSKCINIFRKAVRKLIYSNASSNSRSYERFIFIISVFIHLILSQGERNYRQIFFLDALKTSMKYFLNALIVIYSNEQFHISAGFFDVQRIFRRWSLVEIIMNDTWCCSSLGWLFEKETNLIQFRGLDIIKNRNHNGSTESRRYSHLFR